MVKSGTLFRSGNLWQEVISGTIRQNTSVVAYAGRYMTFRSAAKSVAVSEDGMRGQPLGDSAVARFAFASIRPSTGEWSDKILVWTQNNAFPHNTSTFPSSK